VKGRGIGRFNLQCPGVICYGLFILAQPVIAEGPVVIGPAVPGVELNGLCVVVNGSLKATLPSCREQAQHIQGARLSDLELKGHTLCNTAAEDVGCGT
jgi:hypothetical protein